MFRNMSNSLLSQDNVYCTVHACSDFTFNFKLLCKFVITFCFGQAWEFSCKIFSLFIVRNVSHLSLVKNGVRSGHQGHGMGKRARVSSNDQTYMWTVDSIMKGWCLQAASWPPTFINKGWYYAMFYDLSLKNQNPVMIVTWHSSGVNIQRQWVGILKMICFSELFVVAFKVKICKPWCW